MLKSLKNILISVMAISLIVSPPVFAQEIILQQQNNLPIDTIQANCKEIQTTLRRIHTSDAVLRVNMGQLYNSISVNLMARLNSRLALNRLESTEFVRLANRFDKERENFNENYRQYEKNLSDLIKTDCVNNPVAFYGILLNTRDSRDKVTVATKMLNTTISSYQVQAEKLASKIKQGKNGN